MAGTRVHDILDKFGTAIFPGAYDASSTKLIERVGFSMGFISGYWVAASLLGEPDTGMLTQTEMIGRARQMCRCVSIPIIGDAVMTSSLRPAPDGREQESKWDGFNSGLSARCRILWSRRPLLIKRHRWAVSLL